MAWKHRKESNNTYILFDDNSFDLVAINYQAFMIWRDLQNEDNPIKLAERYSYKFSAEYDEILRDIINIKEELESLGVIESDNKVEQRIKIKKRDIVRNPIWGETAPKAPIRVFITLTRRCNLRCSHCYNESSPNMNEYLSIDVVRQLINEAIELGVFEIILSGGEPFVYPELGKILELAVGKIAVSIVTNGTLVDKTIDILERFTPNRIQISLDGDKKIHDKIRGDGAYLKSLNGINKLKNICQISVGLTITDKLTESGFSDLCLDLKSLGINKISINRLLSSGRAKVQQNSLLSQEVLGNIAASFDIQCSYETENGISSNVFHCGAGISILSVFSDGNIYPCSYLQLCKAEAIGNIYHHSIKKVWMSERLDKFRKENKKYQGPEHCLCDEILKKYDNNL